MNFPVDGGLEVMAAIADELPVGIWVARAPGGEFIYANRTFQEIMGTGGLADVAVGEYAQPYGIFSTSGEPYPEARMPFVRALEARALVTVDDIVIHRPDGRRVNVRAFAKPLADASGAITHVVIAFIDITLEVAAQKARGESERRLQRAQKMESIGNLAGGIAHDFNNLLATVKVLTSLLRMDEKSPLRLESLQQIDQAVESGMNLTRGLLDFAHRDARLEQRVSLNQVARTVLGLVERTFDPRIEVTCERVEQGDEILGDPSRLEQMVMNLVLNARDAMPEGGRLTLRTSRCELDEAEARRRPPLRPGPHVVLEVLDTGVGIDPAIRDRIFEPYFTTKTSGSVKGTGLGLATVHGIVESHRGMIEVAPGDDRGTIMRLFFPATLPAEPRPEPPPPAPPRRLRTGKGLVLLVEDEPALSRASTRVLMTLGYEVLPATDGVEAVELFRGRWREVVAVVLDLILPRMDGQRTFLALREIDAEIPVVITSGSAVEETTRELLELGVRAFLPKPYDAEQLSEVLNRIARPARG